MLWIAKDSVLGGVSHAHPALHLAMVLGGRAKGGFVEEGMYGVEVLSCLLS